LFGHKDSQGNTSAFHLYTMKQAIEEKFILDVLKNYTTFNRYFKLIKTIADDKEYAKKKAIRLLTRYVDLKEYTEKNCNQLPPKVDIPDALKTPDYRILIVANKYQTGFDESLLY
jgi:type I site-specific restriction-modification system R (restriction) subunit